MKKCPVRSIDITEKVVIEDGCQNCFRCVAVCPQKATFGIVTPQSLHYRAEGGDALVVYGPGSTVFYIKMACWVLDHLCSG